MGNRSSLHQDKYNKSNHTKIDKFINAWQYAAIGAGLAKFSGEFTVAQRSVFTYIYNHFDKMDIMNMLYQQVKRGYIISSISLKSGVNINGNGDLGKYRHVFTRNDFDMFVSFTINHLLPFADNVNITFDTNRSLVYIHKKNDDHIYNPYNINIRFNESYKMEDIIRCRDYTLTDDKLQPYRPMTWQDIKCTQDVAVFSALIQSKIKEQFDSEAKAYHKLTGNKLDSNRKPEWDGSASLFTGIDCFDFDSNSCIDYEHVSQRIDNYNSNVKLAVC